MLLLRVAGGALLGAFFLPWFQLDHASKTGVDMLFDMAHEALVGFRVVFAHSSDFAAWSELSRVLFYRRTALALGAVAAGGFGFLLAPRTRQEITAALALGGAGSLMAYWVLAFLLHDAWSLEGDTTRSVVLLFLLDGVAFLPLLLGAAAAVGCGFEQRWGAPLSRALAAFLLVTLVLPDHRGVCWGVRAEVLLLAWAWTRVTPRSDGGEPSPLPA